MPATLWTNSTNYVTFDISAVNFGSDIVADSNSAVIFTLEMYLSTDDVLDTDSDIKSPTLMTENRFSFTGSLKHGDIATLPALKGD